MHYCQGVCSQGQCRSFCGTPCDARDTPSPGGVGWQGRCKTRQSLCELVDTQPGHGNNVSWFLVFSGGRHGWRSREIICTGWINLTYRVPATWWCLKGKAPTRQLLYSLLSLEVATRENKQINLSLIHI